MNSTKLTLMASTIFLAVACATSKTTSKTSTTPAANSGPAATTISLPKSPDGIYPPGKEELTSIQARNQKVTMEHLNEGYTIYSKGACINCHSPNNIYQFDEGSWVKILDDMAIKAKISDTQKAAVYAYILSIKANQPK